MERQEKISVEPINQRLLIQTPFQCVFPACHPRKLALLHTGTNPSKVSNAAIIAIAVVGGVVLLVLLTVLFCCCRSRYKAHQAAAIGAVPDKGPKPKPATPNAPEPFSVNYPQFQVGPNWICAELCCTVPEVGPKPKSVNQPHLSHSV